MKLSQEFISNILFKSELNKEQCKLLNINFPFMELQLENLLDSEIDKRTYELLVLLKSKMALKTQEQIVKNYDLLHALSKEKQVGNIKESASQLQLDQTIKIYCDGACKKNPGEAGSGLAIYHSTSNIPTLLFGDYIEYGTNNIAELNALKKALELVRDNPEIVSVDIFSDSQYSIDCISKWSYSWKKNAWTKKGGEIKNLQLIQEAHEIYDRLQNKINLYHVKGHSGVEGNELADRMAVYSIESRSSTYNTFNVLSIAEVLKMKSY